MQDGIAHLHAHAKKLKKVTEIFREQNLQIFKKKSLRRKGKGMGERRTVDDTSYRDKNLMALFIGKPMYVPRIALPSYHPDFMPHLHPLSGIKWSRSKRHPTKILLFAF